MGSTIGGNMAARGANEKSIILESIKLLFPAMFSVDGKEWRIPVQSNGEILEFKIALTCAKDCIGAESGAMTQSAPVVSANGIEFTEEELQKCRDYLKSMGL